MSEELGIGLLVAVIAAGLAIWGNFLLSQTNKRREERVKFLIDAYVDLEFGHPREHSSGNTKPYTEDEFSEMDRRFNRAMVVINLMGSPEQLELCRKLPNNPNGDLTEISLSLRDSLRKELGLEKTELSHFWLEQRR